VLISSQNRIQKGPLELLVNRTQLGFWEKRICDKLAVCVAPVPGSGSEVQLQGRHATQLSPILLFLFRLLPLADTDFYSMHDMVGCEVGRIISRVVEHSSIFFFPWLYLNPFRLFHHPHVTCLQYIPTLQIYRRKARASRQDDALASNYYTVQTSEHTL
jgi:hypothetical protein